MASLNPADAPAARRPTPARRRRVISRAVHLAGAAALALAVYGPPAVTEPPLPWVRVLVMPALAATGLALWKQAQLRRVAVLARQRLLTALRH